MLQRIRPLTRWPAFLILVVAQAAWLAACGPAAPATPGPGGVTPIGPTGSVPAPIESVSLEYGVGTPPRSYLVIVSGLPDGCTTFGDYTLSRQGDLFRVEVTNRRPSNPDLVCTQIYGLVTTRIPLEGEIKPCQVYTAVVNGQEYRVQAIGPTMLCAPPPASSGTTTPPAEMPQTSSPAPIESVSLEYGVGTPPQSFLVIVSGLPDGCTTFGGYTLSRQGDVFRVEVTNRRPSNPDLVCTHIYGLVTTRIPLEGEIKPCQVYTAVVNGQEYRAQAIGPTMLCAPPPASSGTTTPPSGDGAELRLRVGQSLPVGASGLVIKLVGVPEDSRCPRSVVCVWEGQAAVTIGVTQGGVDQGSFRLVRGGSAAGPAVVVAGYQVRLADLGPYPASPGAIPVGDYLAVLVVSKT